MLRKIHTQSLFGLVLLSLTFLAACASQQPMESDRNTEAQNQTTTETADNADREKLHVLYLGDNGHHQPLARLRDVIHVYTQKGIQIHYTDQQDDINYETLKNYDVFMLYGNRSGLSKQQEVDLLRYVHEGGGFVGIHSASASFNDSDAFVNLIGGAFKAHGTGTFSVDQVGSDHPVKDGVPNFESWDETYVHMRLNPENEVLSVRVEGDHEEPWTWVRNEGEGRVFYTAWGHDQRTWTNEGFQTLLENAFRWTAGDWALDADFSPAEFTYGEGVLPNYPAGERWGTVDDPITDVQNPLSVEDALDHMVVKPEFDVQLFASEPDIVNPIDMAWDQKGRLWITETVDYPNKFEDDREGSDRIKILEDTNGDGKADTFTVFAEGLNIATGLVPYKDGVIVAQAPDFFYLSDTDGDGKADTKEVLFTGWGTFDTHAGPSNLRYGYDNQIWGAVGYSAFDGTVGGEDHRFSSGFYRFQPDGSKLEYISNTTNNTWGLGFSEDGLVFGSTANRDVPLFSAIPNRFYNAIRGTGNPRIPRIADTNIIFPVRENIRQVDQHGRYTAGSGFEMYTARNFPQSYWNKKGFVNEPTGRVIGQFRFEKDGSSFVAYNELNQLASLDDWFAPIQTRVGPDGALWVADWYNLIIQHNPVPAGFEGGEGNAYVTDLRDKTHARIYRIVHKDGNHNAEMPDLTDASADELVETLKHDNMFWRLTAQRLIVERGDTDVLPALYELVKDKSTDEIGLNPGAFHALWTIHGLGQLNENSGNRQALNVALAALHHPVTAVRRAALMTLPRTNQVLDHVLAAEFIPDTEIAGETEYSGYAMPARTMTVADPQLRLAALLALAELPAHEKAGYGAAELLVVRDNANDRWLRDGITAAGANNEVSFLSKVLEKNLPNNADSTYKANVADVVSKVAHHYALGENPSANVSEFLAQLPDAHPAIAHGFVTGLAEGWAEVDAPSFSSSVRNQLSSLRGNVDESLQEALDALADAWESPDLFGSR